jgi:hypothetical protein
VCQKFQDAAISQEDNGNDKLGLSRWNHSNKCKVFQSVMK